MAAEVAVCFGVFEQIEGERARVLAWLGGWPEGAVRFRPAPGAWAATEVLDHIVRAESGTTAAMCSGLRSPRVLGDAERPGVAALDRALRSDGRFQVPAGAEAIWPEAEIALPAVTRRWEQARAELRSVLEGMTEGGARGGVFCHPFAGWMTVEEVLLHFAAHLQHHVFQMERLRGSWEERRV